MSAVPPISSFSGAHVFLSNFHPCELSFGGGMVFPSAEHAYQAAKAVDDNTARLIASAGTAAEAKRFGRTVPLRPGWEGSKIEVMRRILRVKFGEDTALAEQLVATHPAYLIEGNTWGDKFWGCVNEGGTWVGRNELGLLLMERRNELLPGGA